MRVDTQVQRASNAIHVLESQLAAEAGVSNSAGHVPIAGQVTGDGANRETDRKDLSIYDFNTHAEGEEGIRLLIRSGFDGMHLWLVEKQHQGEGHPPAVHENDYRINWVDRRAPFWGGVPDFVFESAWKTGPHILMMHGNSAEAGKAHGVLVDHTNDLIEECLQFR